MGANTLWQKILKRYFINGLNGMALGLFCTLIVGLIIKQIGTFIGGDVGAFVVALGNFATMCTGAAIGVGTAYVMEAPRMVVFSSAVTGLLGANAAAFANGTLFPETGGMLLGGSGNWASGFRQNKSGYYRDSCGDHWCRWLYRNADWASFVCGYDTIG